MNAKAIGLVSGGLDSLLAVALLLKQGVEVRAVNFRTGFSGPVGDEDAVERRLQAVFASEFFRQFSGTLAFETLHVEAGYLEVLSNPKYGFGKNVNPCIDCRIYSFRNAKAYMEETGADFIFTGEVLGQRPMTQQRNTMQQIANQAGLKGKVLRPLCARLLNPTLPEAEGLIDRNQLLNIAGRGRKRQIALAAELGLTEYPQPAGGCCYLTDPGYARRFKDLVRYREQGDIATRDFQLLKLGRHLRIAPDFKVIVGRDEKENQLLEEYFSDHSALELVDHPGPLVLVEGELTPERIELAARITLRYSNHKEDGTQVEFRGPDGNLILTVDPLPDAVTADLIIK